jgi:hypothetical protein
MKIKESLIMLLFKKNLHSWVRVSVLSILIIGSIFLLQACFPFGPEDLEDFDIVGTFYDENVNFSNFKTYAMPDTIVKITGAGVSSSKGQYDDLILDQIEANMGAVGYTRVQNPDQADMLLTVAVVNDEYNMNSSYDYGDYYGDPYDYGSGGYYDTGSDYQVSTGTVLMNLANHKDGDTTRESSMWVGILNGILEQSFTNTSRRLIELINQAFVQSPYLGTTP